MFHWEKRKIYNIDISLMPLNTRICSLDKTNTPIPKFSLRVSKNDASNKEKEKNKQIFQTILLHFHSIFFFFFLQKNKN